MIPVHSKVSKGLSALIRRPTLIEEAVLVRGPILSSSVGMLHLLCEPLLTDSTIGSFPVPEYLHIYLNESPTRRPIWKHLLDWSKLQHYVNKSWHDHGQSASVPALHAVLSAPRAGFRVGQQYSSISVWSFGNPTEKSSLFLRLEGNRHLDHKRRWLILKYKCSDVVFFSCCVGGTEHIPSQSRQGLQSPISCDDAVIIRLRITSTMRT